MNKKTLLSIGGVVVVIAVLGFGYKSFNKAPSPPPMDEKKTGDAMMEDVETPMAQDSKQDTMKISYMDVSPQEANDLIEQMPGLVIVDVSPNYAKGHLPGAVNYYVGDGSLDEAIPTLDKSLPYLVYCHVDSAAIAGAQKLVNAGFTKVYRLEGNYSGWVEAGFPIEIPEN